MDFLITGTQAYGPTNPDSDLDIVIKHKDVLDIAAFLNDHNIKWYRTKSQDEYGDNGGFYFNLATIKVNIVIATDDADFDLWKERTEKMKKLPEIPDRQVRLNAFNSALPIDDLKKIVNDMFKGTLAER